MSRIKALQIFLQKDQFSIKRTFRFAWTFLHSWKLKYKVLSCMVNCHDLVVKAEDSSPRGHGFESWRRWRDTIFPAPFIWIKAWIKTLLKETLTWFCNPASGRADIEEFWPLKSSSKVESSSADWEENSYVNLCYILTLGNSNLNLTWKLFDWVLFAPVELKLICLVNIFQ